MIVQVLDQVHRPVEVLVSARTPRLDALLAGGVDVRTGTPIAPWVADWRNLGRERSATHLLDLVCAQEATGADVVGYTAARDDDYAFVPDLEIGLVRRSLFQVPRPEGGWSRAGFRQLAITEEAAP